MCRRPTSTSPSMAGSRASASAIVPAMPQSCTAVPSWVRNEWDVSVTMEIQGEEGNIDRVILAIGAGRYVKIENMDNRMIPVDTEEQGFKTR